MKKKIIIKVLSIVLLFFKITNISTFDPFKKLPAGTIEHAVAIWDPQGVPPRSYSPAAKAKTFSTEPWSIILNKIKVPKDSTYVIKDADGIPLITIQYDPINDPNGTSLVKERGAQALLIWSAIAEEDKTGNRSNSNKLTLTPLDTLYPTVEISTHTRMTPEPDRRLVSAGVSFQTDQSLNGTTYNSYAELDCIRLTNYLTKFYPIYWQEKPPMAWSWLNKSKKYGWPIMAYVNISIDPSNTIALTIDSIEIVLLDKPERGPIVTINRGALKDAGIVQAGEGKNPFMTQTNKTGS